MAPLSAPASEFIAQICDSTLHGVYTVLFFTAIYLLLFRRKMTRINAVMLLVTVVMYSVSTTYEALSVRGNMVRLLANPATQNSEVFDKLSAKTFITQIYLEVTNMVIGDCVVVWRAWVLYDRRPWFIIISGCLLGGTAASGFGLAHELSVSPPGTSLFEGSVAVWGLMTIIMTILTNVWATVLIAWRAWAHTRRVRKLLGQSAHKNRYISVLLLIVESGAIYALTWLACGITQATGTNGVFIMTDMLVQLTGIYPTLIVVLVCLKATQQDAITRFEATSLSGGKNGSETLRFHSANRSAQSVYPHGGSSNGRSDASQSQKLAFQGTGATISFGLPADLGAGHLISEESIIALKEVGMARDDVDIENVLRKDNRMY